MTGLLLELPLLDVPPPEEDPPLLELLLPPHAASRVTTPTHRPTVTDLRKTLISVSLRSNSVASTGATGRCNRLQRTIVATIWRVNGKRLQSVLGVG